jgi:hypothetical protein
VAMGSDTSGIDEADSGGLKLSPALPQHPLPRHVG